jgi:hypothetical protein
MRQALHILRKDVRYLYREIILIWILAAVYVWAGGWAETLLIANAAFLIGRLIHGETIAGNRQFWITRPYFWKSLLGAKLIFILACVSLPVMLAQLGILAEEGFPLVTRLPALLWSQILLTLCVWFPIAALAALTSNSLVFIFNCLGLLAVGFMGTQTFFGRSAAWPSGMEWIRISAAVVVLAGLALSIFYLQYKDRRTALSRAVAVGVALIGLIVYQSLPWPAAFRLQSWLGRASAEARPVQLALKPGASMFFQDFLGRSEAITFRVPLVVSNIPPGDDVRLDMASATIQISGGQSWTGRAFTILGVTEKNRSAEFDASFPIDAAFSRAAARQPATVRISADLTLFTNSHRATAVLADKFVNVADGMQCFRDRFSVLFCRAPFRWPAALVYAKISDTVVSPLNSLISYAPFPAGLSLNPIEQHWAAGPPLSQPEVTLIWKEPVAYFERDLTISGVQLGPYRYINGGAHK